MSDLIAMLEERATFEDERVLEEAKRQGFVPEVYNGSQTGALLREAAAALEAAREDGARLEWLADQMRITDLHFILDSVPLKPCELRAAIDQARGKAGGEVEGA